MSSAKLSIVTLSTALVLFTRTVKATGPPGSATLVGTAVLMTSIEDGTSVIVTTASSSSLTGFPSSSVPEAVTTSVSLYTALPVTFAVKEQE